MSLSTARADKMPGDYRHPSFGNALLPDPNRLKRRASKAASRDPILPTSSPCSSRGSLGTGPGPIPVTSTMTTEGTLEQRIAWLLLPVTALLLLLPLAAVTIPPLHDYPFHLARADAIAALFGQVDHPTHHQIGDFLLPNVAMDVVTLGLTAFLPPILAGRVFLGLVLLILLTGTVALHRAVHGRMSPWPLLAAFFLYNWIFFYGFTNYLFGLGMTLWGAAIWLATRRAGVAARVMGGTSAGIVTVFCQLMAFGLLAVIVGGLALTEIWVTWRQSKRLDFAGLLSTAVPLLITLLVFLAVSPTAGEAAQPFIYHTWIGWKPLM